MEREEFIELVKQAVRELPESFRERMENVSIVVEDSPSVQDAARAGANPRNLLGLYQGVPLRRRTIWRDPVMPDKITIYQLNIEAVARSSAAVKSLVCEVVMHEIGHHFGLDENELRQAQAGPE